MKTRDKISVTMLIITILLWLITFTIGSWFGAWQWHLQVIVLPIVTIVTFMVITSKYL